MPRFRKIRAPAGARPGTLAPELHGNPTRVRVFEFDASSFTEVESQELPDLSIPAAPGKVRWVEVVGLGSRPTLLELARCFGLHDLVLEDIVHVPQRPKSEPYPSQHLLVTRSFQLDSPLLVHSCQLSVVIGDGYVVSFQEKQDGVLLPVLERLRLGQGRIRASGYLYLAYALLDAVVDTWFPVVESLGEALDALEGRILNSPQPHQLRSLGVARSTLLELRRSVWAQREAIGQILRSEGLTLPPEFTPYLRDTQDHCSQLIDGIESYLEQCAHLMNTYLSITGSRTNEVMKLLTLLTAFFIPLSFLTGLYGMNFENMPELRSPHGYYVLLLVMASIACGMIYWFHKRGWLRGDE